MSAVHTIGGGRKKGVTNGWRRRGVAWRGVAGRGTVALRCTDQRGRGVFGSFPTCACIMSCSTKRAPYASGEGQRCTHAMEKDARKTESGDALFLLWRLWWVVVVTVVVVACFSFFCLGCGKSHTFYVCACVVAAVTYIHRLPGGGGSLVCYSPWQLWVGAGRRGSK